VTMEPQGQAQVAGATHSSLGFEVEGGDVIKLMLQFLNEQGLSRSARELQEETGVALNTVDSKEQFASDVRHGRWDAVLPAVSRMKLPGTLLMTLYEQVVLELVECREVALARELLRTSAPLRLLRSEEPERYLLLENLAQRPIFDATAAYGTQHGQGKERRRAELADRLTPHLVTVAPSRLLALVGQALKWQQHNGMLSRTGQFDLFRGSQRSRRAADLEERQVKREAGQIRFGSQSHAESAIFSPDGTSLLTGSVDGFVEVWDFETCRLRRDLPYQATPDDERFMMHDKAVLAITFSRDGEMLASGSQDCKIKIWRLSTGKLLRRFERAHTSGVTCLAFARDGSQILSGSFDHSVRVHGLKSGKTLKDLRGHGSYVNAVCYSEDGTRGLSASSDGQVRVWDLRSSECLVSFSLGEGLAERAVHSLLPLPAQPDLFLAVPRSSTAYVVNLQGQVVRSFSSGKKEGGDFVCCTMSPRGKWVYCGAEDGNAYCFDLGHDEAVQLEQTFQVTEKKEVLGMAHHPHRNIVATFAQDGLLRLWRP